MSASRERIGQRVAGRYRIESELSRGGMGVVYRAVQEPLGRDIALKVMLPGPAADQTLRRRFIQEAQALSRTVHPNIVTIFDFGEVEDGALFIAMELVPGQNLRELLQQRRRIDWRDSLAMAVGATRALVVAHAAGITHRDLKPDNIMLVGGRWRAEDVKLLDFGLARTLSEGEQLTQVNVIPGTPHYIAPERVSSRDEDPRSDLYALGAIWFELLTGQLPFQGDTVGAILLAHVQRETPTLSQVAPHLKVPADIETVVARLMAKRPEERWPSSAAFSGDLEALAARLTGQAAPTPARFAAPATSPPPSRWTSSAANVAAPAALTPSRTPVMFSSSSPSATVVEPAHRVASSASSRRPPAPSGPLKVGDEVVSIEETFDEAARRYVCAAVFRGRLLRKVELDVPAEVTPARRASWQAGARADFEAGLRHLLARARSPDELAPPQASAEARLFFFALEAYLGGDAATALRTVEGLRQALPDDVRLANTQKKLLLERDSG